MTIYKRIFIALLVVLLVGCSTFNNALIRTDESHTLVSSGNRITYITGKIKVPFNRSNPSSEKFEMTYYHFSRISTASKSTPPIFDLPGGPGSRDLAGLLKKDWYFPTMIEPYLEYTDYIMVNHRGFSGSFETACSPAKDIPIYKINDKKYTDNNFAVAAKQCRKKWQDKGVDLPSFNSFEAAADVKDLARSLEYDQIQLIANSYGSHWGLNVVRYFPELVARATFSAIEGPDHTYDMPQDVLAVFKTIATAAEQNPQFKGLIPEEGLINGYKKKIDELDLKPVIVKAIHPENKIAFDYELNGDDVRFLLFGYNSGVRWRYQMKDWVSDLIKVINGDYTAAVNELMYQKFNTDLNEAAYYQTDCGSGLSAERGAKLRNDSAHQYIGKTWSYYDRVCQYWKADLGEGYRSSFSSNVPTLLVQGTWDVYTPINNAYEILPMFKNGKLVVVEGGSHGALREAKENNKQFSQGLHHWLSTGDMSLLPEKVTMPAMQWSQLE